MYLVYSLSYSNLFQI